MGGVSDQNLLAKIRFWKSIGPRSGVNWNLLMRNVGVCAVSVAAGSAAKSAARSRDATPTYFPMALPSAGRQFRLCVCWVGFPPTEQCAIP